MSVSDFCFFLGVVWVPGVRFWIVFLLLALSLSLCLCFGWRVVGLLVEGVGVEGYRAPGFRLVDHLQEGAAVSQKKRPKRPHEQQSHILVPRPSILGDTRNHGL